MWYEDGTVSGASERHLLADERGSIIAIADATGMVLNVNSYDSYGIGGEFNIGRFQYTTVDM